MSLHCRVIHDVLSMPLIPIVGEIGMRGIPIDTALRDDMIFNLMLKQGERAASLRRDGITEFGSRMRLGHQLKSLGVPLTVFTEGGAQYKTDLEIFGRLNHRLNTLRERDGKPPKFPFLKELIDHARLTKAKSNMEALCPCQDGLLRTRLQSSITATARYASSGWGRKNRPGFCPTCRVWARHGTNLQNIPKDNLELGINVKDVFVPSPGWMLGELDYRAYELMIQAKWMKCQKLINRLTEPGADPHTYHARVHWGPKEFDAFPKDARKRRRATMKNVIYGMRGGGGDKALLSAMAKKDEFFSLDEMAAFRATIFKEYPEMLATLVSLDASLKAQLKRGERRVVYNALGRPRVLCGRSPEKEAIATIVSGTGAEIMNCVIKRLAVYHPWALQYVVMQIHDSIVVHAPKDIFPAVMDRVAIEMSSPVWQWGEFVTYGVDMKASDVSWAAMSAWEAGA
jgi:DNA polymerase I-like protein with 3'-5' exonuclease and polymerase domains